MYHKWTQEEIDALDGIVKQEGKRLRSKKIDEKMKKLGYKIEIDKVMLKARELRRKPKRRGRNEDGNRTRRGRNDEDGGGEKEDEMVSDVTPPEKSILNKIFNKNNILFKLFEMLA